MFVLSELFGSCPEVKIVETFAEYHDDTLSGADIIEMTDVAKGTVYSHINKLLEEGIIIKVDQIGKTKLYQLNNENPKAKIILILERFIVSERLERLVEKEPDEIATTTINCYEQNRIATPETTLFSSGYTSQHCGVCASSSNVSELDYIDNDWRVMYD